MKTIQSIKKDRIEIEALGGKVSASGYIAWGVIIFIFIVAIVYIEKKFSPIRKRMKRKK